jgi:hypothetical protein
MLFGLAACMTIMFANMPQKTVTFASLYDSHVRQRAGQNSYVSQPV